MNSTTVLFSLTRSGSVPNREIVNEGFELTQTKTSKILIHTSLVPNLPIGNANENKQKLLHTFLVPNLLIGNVNENRKKVHSSLSYKVNHILNSTSGPFFSNQIRLRSQSGDW